MAKTNIEYILELRQNNRVIMRESTQEQRNNVLKMAQFINRHLKSEDKRGVSTIGFASNVECVICIN